MLVRGVDQNPPKGLDKLTGVARSEFLVETECPDLQDQGKVTFTPPDRVRLREEHTSASFPHTIQYRTGV